VGIGSFAITRPSPAPPAPAAPPVSAPPLSAPIPEPKPTTNVTTSATVEVMPAQVEGPPRRVKVVVAPADVAIELDGAKATLNKQGLLEIAGKLGSNHRVKLSKGKNETTVDVAITDDGPSVPKIELLPPGAKPPSSATPAASAPPPKPGIINNFE
jgi:hypothetical protein